MNAPMESQASPDPPFYDVVVVGGAVAGASTATVLRRANPALRILVVEKTERFDWKVGESTVEVSSYFLTRVLKLWTYLSREQLPKQAFRYWFFNDDVTCLREASETGPTQLARTPSFQLTARSSTSTSSPSRRRRAPSSGDRRRSPAGRSAKEPRPTRSRSRRATERPRPFPAAGWWTPPAVRRCWRANAAA